jgi:hypothetical protein
MSQRKPKRIKNNPPNRKSSEAGSLQLSLRWDMFSVLFFLRETRGSASRR